MNNTKIVIKVLKIDLHYNHYKQHFNDDQFRNIRICSNILSKLITT